MAYPAFFTKFCAICNGFLAMQYGFFENYGKNRARTLTGRRAVVKIILFRQALPEPNKP
jgi:hypothetical protein